MNAIHGLNWNALYSFWLVAKCGSFAEAARRLQSGTIQGLHKRVRQLEGEAGLNLKLLKSRGVKGVELTDAGRHIQTLIDPIYSDFGRVVAELRHEDSGGLRLATTGLGAYNYVPEILNKFRACFPRVSVSVRVTNEAEVIGMAEAGLVDFAIAAAPSHSRRLLVAARSRLTFHLVGPPDHRWTNQPISWVQVVAQPLILPERVSGIRISLEDLLTRKRLISNLKVAAEVTTAELAIELVRSGFGIALVPYAPRLAEAFDSLSVVDVPPGLAEKNIAVMRQDGHYMPSYMKRFQEIAAEALRRARKRS